MWLYILFFSTSIYFSFRQQDAKADEKDKGQKELASSQEKSDEEKNDILELYKDSPFKVKDIKVGDSIGAMYDRPYYGEGIKVNKNAVEVIFCDKYLDISSIYE